jgi:hypothetical protein
MFRVVRLQLVECRITRSVKEVLDELRVMMADLEPQAVLAESHADHLDIHPMGTSALVILQVESVSVKHQTRPRSGDKATEF